MLVFFSDIHMTDGTAAQNVNAGAFEMFADQVIELAQKREANEVRLVLLGDGFDVIRTSRWLDDEHGVRPWSPPSSEQEQTLLEILRDTVDRNRAGLDFLRALPRRVAERSKVPEERVTVDYVIGNHDWPIARYRSTREFAVRELGLPPEYVEHGFPLRYTSPAKEYDVVARHGDAFDRLNYETGLGRNASSLGDVIVVELLCRFPLEVRRELAGQPNHEDIVERLKGVDNVRPYSRIPAWVADTITELGRGDERFARAAGRALERCVSDFVRSSTVRDYLHRQLSWSRRFYLRALLSQAVRGHVGMLDRATRLGDRLLRVWRMLWGEPGSHYAGRALEEVGVDGYPPRFVVYGHTHWAEILPLTMASRDGHPRYYLNSGTWRSVWQRSEAMYEETHFASWKEMSYVAIYNPAEANRKHEFEMWTGSLRDRSSL